MNFLSESKIVSFIMTTDKVRSKDFYEKKLGLAFEYEDPFGMAFNLKDASLRITEVKEYTPSEHPILGWMLSDLQQYVESLTLKGVTMLVYEGFGQDSLGIWNSPDGKTKLAWINDPDGNVLCLMEKS